jgi:hypothetical protein
MLQLPVVPMDPREPPGLLHPVGREYALMALEPISNPWMWQATKYLGRLPGTFRSNYNTLDVIYTTV